MKPVLTTGTRPKRAAYVNGALRSSSAQTSCRSCDSAGIGGGSFGQLDFGPQGIGGPKQCNPDKTFSGVSSGNNNLFVVGSGKTLKEAKADVIRKCKAMQEKLAGEMSKAIKDYDCGECRSWIWEAPVLGRWVIEECRKEIHKVGSDKRGCVIVGCTHLVSGIPDWLKKWAADLKPGNWYCLGKVTISRRMKFLVKCICPNPNPWGDADWTLPPTTPF